MDLERLFIVLSSITKLSNEFKVALSKEMTRLSLPRNYLLLEAPKISDHAYFLESGFAMSYTFVKGKVQAEKFWASGEIIVSAKSFFEQVASTEFIKLMKQSEVLFISYNAVQHLLNGFPEANFIYQITMNRYCEHYRQRMHDMQYLNSVERYSKLIATFPAIEQIITQEHIASYLGIAPQSLSRIKKQMKRS
jgi:CRP-like cAMP-binding protein